MMVTVKLFNQLQRFAPAGQGVFEERLPSGASLNDLLRQLKIPATVPRTTLVNGRRVADDAQLAANDEIVLMSPIEGG
ncbi:MAG: MoaD/ThiS family protein [Desulfosarcinaceae bacterium]|nr:MoaD/ThiS family protein [Desulfosarcinaceae bacterium]